MHELGWLALGIGGTLLVLGIVVVPRSVTLFLLHRFRRSSKKLSKPYDALLEAMTAVMANDQPADHGEYFVVNYDADGNATCRKCERIGSDSVDVKVQQKYSPYDREIAEKIPPSLFTKMSPEEKMKAAAELARRTFDEDNKEVNGKFRYPPQDIKVMDGSEVDAYLLKGSALGSYVSNTPVPVNEKGIAWLPAKIEHMDSSLTLEDMHNDKEVLDIDLRKIRIEVEKIVQSGPDMVTMGKLPQTPRAKKVVEYSIEEARNLNHNYVGTEHLLLGLLREQEGVAAQVLKNLGLNLEKVRQEVLSPLGKEAGKAVSKSDV